MICRKFFRNCLNAVAIAFMFLAPAIPAWADTFAAIGSTASSDPANPTPVQTGTTLNVWGSCGHSWFTTRSGATYLIFKDGELQGTVLKNRRSPSLPENEAAWLDHPAVDINVGSAYATTTVGARFAVELSCAPANFGTSSTKRYFQVTAPNAPPKVEWLNTNPRYSNGDTRIQMRVTGTNDGVGEVYIRWTGEAARDLKMQHVSGDIYEYTIAATPATMQDGIKQVDIWATSQSGANNGWVPAGSFTFDGTVPTITWDSSNPARPTGDRITIKAAISDPSGIADVWILWTGGTSFSIPMKKNRAGLYEYTIDTSKLPPGIQYVQIWAKDNAGNNTNWIVKGKFAISRLPPTIEWDRSNPAWTRSGIHINVDITDPDSSSIKAWIWWTGETSSTVEMKKGPGKQYYYYIPALPDGVKDVQIYAENGEKHNTGWVSLGTFTVDKTAPVIDSASINMADGHIDIKAIIQDRPAGVESAWASFADSPVADGNTKMNSKGADIFEARIKTADLSNGVHTLRIKAVDLYGNTTGWIGQGTVTVDRRPPTVEWLDTNPAYSTGKITVRVRVTGTTDGVGNVFIMWTEEPKRDLKMRHVDGDIYEYTITASADMEDGIKQVDIWATSQNGAHAGWANAGRFTLDRNGPVIDWSTPQDLASFSGDGVHVAGTLSDAAPKSVTIEWREENTALWQSMTLSAVSDSSIFNYDLPALDSRKRYQLRLRAVDAAGNVSAYTAIRTVLAGNAKEKEKLLLQKTVDRDVAKPGDTLRYTITYTNISSENLHHLVIIDEIQDAFLVLQQAQCGPSNPSGLACCVASAKGGNCGPVATGPADSLEWHLKGTLAAGESGSVNYDARIRQ